mmetsp:Transcript_10663/g.10529  ORF Transcript_10663/g.10529 Transcript_10663/m.10529 type:complete len:134 (+) Transcript_10663:330-731(+)
MLIKQILRIKQEVQEESNEEDQVPDCPNDALVSRIIKESDILPRLLSEYSKYNSKTARFKSEDETEAGNSNEPDEERGLLYELKKYSRQKPILQDDKEDKDDEEDQNAQDDDNEGNERDQDKSNYKDDLKRLL